MENSLEPLDDKEKKKLQSYYDNKPMFDAIIQRLRDNISDNVYLNVADFDLSYLKLWLGLTKNFFLNSLMACPE